jgi:2-furoyl-CoA dehydrogenase large subunit
MTTVPQPEQWVGKAVLRLEDPALLRGRARFVDDLPIKAGTLHAAIVRSPHAHAEIVSIDAAKAMRAPGVAAAGHTPSFQKLA